jgi:ferredoxin
LVFRSLLRQGLGTAGSHLVNAEKLAKILAGPSGSITLSAQRAKRIEAVLEILKSHIQKLQQRKSYLLFTSHTLPDEMTLSQGEIITNEDCFEAAGKRFEEISRDLVAVCRALRTAELETQDAYAEAEHDGLINNLAWFSLNEEERSYLQPILIFENSQVLNGPLFNSFANLLLNRYPVTTVISQSIIGKKSVVDAKELIRSQTDWGYLVMAYRAAYVLQSSLSQPSHLLSDLLEIGSAVRPAVAFVAVPSWDTPMELAQVQLKAAIESRITPLYRYNPEGGLSFPERFQLSMNPQPQTQWPVHTIHCLDEDDQRQEIISEFTFAHFAATDPAYRANFQIIERAAWADNQIRLYIYLNDINNLPPNVIPYIQIIDEQGEIQRAVITRPLAFACWQRILSWRNLQERAGIKNIFVENARSQALSEGEKKLQAELAQMEERHERELVAQAQKTTTATINRLVEILLNSEKMDGQPTPAMIQEMLAPEEKPVEPSPPPEQLESSEPAVSPAATALIEIPYIESALCSSCNDCINLNSMMFQYNDNKEAYIAEAQAGTYLQLVKAAEKCPSRCIHPGLPREDDKTADDKLIARANEYN